jgi:hypothetical protein
LCEVSNEEGGINFYLFATLPKANAQEKAYGNILNSFLSIIQRNNHEVHVQQYFSMFSGIAASHCRAIHQLNYSKRG